MIRAFPEVKDGEEIFKIIGQYGLTGRQQVCPIRQVSGGKRLANVFLSYFFEWIISNEFTFDRFNKLLLFFVVKNFITC